MSPHEALEQSRLRVEVESTRIRLRLIEQKHERVLEHGSPSDVLTIGREYAAAIQSHSTAVMAWLISIEKHGHQGDPGRVTE